MVKYKLTYFRGTGRAEVARQLFALANQEYEDIRINKQTEWPQLKSSTSFGQLPILEVDGQVLSQGHAINRYLARQFGYAGKTDWEQARVDMIGDCIEDFVAPTIMWARATEPQVKADIEKKFMEEQAQSCLSNFEKFLVENKSGFFVGEEMTWADLLFVESLTWSSILMGLEVNLSECPRCRALQQSVSKHPAIAAWIEKRPPTIL